MDSGPRKRTTKEGTEVVVVEVVPHALILWRGDGGGGGWRGGNGGGVGGCGFATETRNYKGKSEQII